MTNTEVKTASAAVKAILLSNPEGLHEVIRAVMQEVLEAEMEEALGASKRERTPERLGYRSGHYGRTLITRVGKLELRVPQDRAGRFSTELFERYQRSERALVATLAQMYVQGVRPARSRQSPRSVRSCLLGLVDLDDQQASGREPEGVCRAPACGALSLPHPRCPLREGARSRYRHQPGSADCGRHRLGWPAPDTPGAEPGVRKVGGSS